MKTFTMTKILDRYKLPNKYKYFVLIRQTYTSGNKEKAVKLFGDMTSKDKKYFMNEWLKDTEEADKRIKKNFICYLINKASVSRKHIKRINSKTNS